MNTTSYQTRASQLNPFAPSLAIIFSIAIILLAALTMAGCADNDPVAPPQQNTNTASTPASRYSGEVPMAWFALQNKLIEKTPGFTPPVASRALGYSGVALYEAVVAGMPENRSLVGELNGLTAVPQPDADKAYYWPGVANSVLAAITRKLYANASAEYKARIDSLEAAFNASFSSKASATAIERSVAHGRAVADAIFEWSKSDGGHEGYMKNFPTDYTAPVGPGLWVPTPRPSGAPQSALQPYWGKNRPFALPVGDVNRFSDPGAPPAYSEDPSSAFYREGHEVYTTVKNLTPQQNEIALYWADDAGRTCTPPGHSMSILCQCCEMQGMTLDRSAEAIAKLGIAVADAFIACWETKYRYNLLRPISYIQRVIDPTWNTPTITDPVVTPPFPEYPSGHSVQSGASAQVLEGILGEHFAFTDHTHDAAGLRSRSFGSFREFASEAAISRLYGGIHYRAAIERGVEQGRKIGQMVNSLRFKK